MDTVVSLISTVGFPIVAALGLAWFIYLIWNNYTERTDKQMERIEKRAQEREDKLYEQIERFGTTLNNFNITLASIDTRLEMIERQSVNKEKS